MFYGRFEHNIDKKGRMTVPSSYREQTVGDLVCVTKGLDGNLMAHSKDKFDVISNSISEMSITDPLLRALRRDILGGTYELPYDTAGRILIPTDLRNFAGIDEKVVIIGVGDSFEIWSFERLKAEEDLDNDPKAKAERYKMFNISTRGN